MPPEMTREEPAGAGRSPEEQSKCPKHRNIIYIHYTVFLWSYSSRSRLDSEMLYMTEIFSSVDSSLSPLLSLFATTSCSPMVGEE